VILLRETPQNFQPAALLVLSATMMGLELIFIKRLTELKRPLRTCTTTTSCTLRWLF